MPATSLRNHSPTNKMARQRTLRCAMASASAKMPRRRVIWGFFGLSVGPCPDLLTTNAHTSERILLIRSDFQNLNGDISSSPHQTALRRGTSQPVELLCGATGRVTLQVQAGGINADKGLVLIVSS